MTPLTPPESLRGGRKGDAAWGLLAPRPHGGGCRASCPIPAGRSLDGVPAQTRPHKPFGAHTELRVRPAGAPSASQASQVSHGPREGWEALALGHSLEGMWDWGL